MEIFYRLHKNVAIAGSDDDARWRRAVILAPLGNSARPSQLAFNEGRLIGGVSAILSENNIMAAWAFIDISHGFDFEAIGTI